LYNSKLLLKTRVPDRPEPRQDSELKAARFRPMQEADAAGAKAMGKRSQTLPRFIRRETFEPAFQPEGALSTTFATRNFSPFIIKQENLNAW